MPELKDFHTRWYGSGHKELPTDFEITPTTLLHLYLCDGSFQLNRGKTPQIIICTDSFQPQDVIALAEKISSIVAPARRIEKCNRIRIPKDSVSKFLNFIGPSPVKSLSYKWGTNGI